MNLFLLLLLLILIFNAISVVLTKNLLATCLIFMAQSTVMVLVWILLESPDLAITEAAVGAGVSSLLMFITLKKIHVIDEETRKGGESRNE
ncbi:MAG: DUF4040 domain-containing protein [Clostridia bacterium]|nr:DUF4040 domain-containing protein [Clostridia bacterium]